MALSVLKRMTIEDYMARGDISSVKREIAQNLDCASMAEQRAFTCDDYTGKQMFTNMSLARLADAMEIENIAVKMGYKP